MINTLVFFKCFYLSFLIGSDDTFSAKKAYHRHNMKNVYKIKTYRVIEFKQA